MRASTSTVRSNTSFGPIQIGIIVLTIVTALVHLFRAINMPSGTFQTLFYLNFLGYVVLLAALYLPQFIQWRSLVRWALIAFTAITIVAYFVITRGRFNPVGYIDKIVEIALIVMLFIEGRAPQKRI